MAAFTNEGSVRAAYHRRSAAWLPLAVTLLAVALMGLTACGDQPKPDCLTSPFFPYATKLYERDRMESAEGACDGFGPDGFNADPRMGVIPYYARDSKGQTDFGRGSLAIQTSEIGTLAYTAQDFMIENSAEDGSRYSLGKFTVRKPNDDNMCPAPELSPTHLVLDEVPAIEDDPETEDDESFPGQPAVDITLEWSNFLVYVTAASSGTQIQADLADTRRTPDGETCTIKYRAVGLAPAVPCQDVDENGDPAFNEDDTPKLDPTLCSPLADPSKMRFSGSGISPDAKVSCDPVIAYCVLDSEEIPALQ